MTDLVAFVRARLDEYADDAPDLHDYGCATAGPLSFPCDCGYPARVLREVEAMRAIVDAYEVVLKECATMLGDRRPRKYGEHDGLRIAVCHLAAIWRGHKDYDPA